MASFESPPLPRARPPPPPNPFVVLERDFLQTELGKQSLAAWGVIQSALAPWVRSASEALQPALRTVNEVLLLPIANALALEPTDGEFSPVVSVVVPVLMLIGLGFLMRQLVKRWDRRAHHHKRNPFAARGTVADAEAKGEQPLLGMNSSRSDKSPRGRFAFGAGVRDRTTKDVPEIRIGLPSGTPAPGGPLPPMTARGGPDSSRSSSGGGRFMPAFDPASEAMQSSRSLRSARGHPPRSEKQLPAKSPRNSAMMRPDWLDAVGRGGPHHCGPTEGETPRLMRPSTTPRQALSTSTPRGAGGNEGILTASAAANTNSWFGGATPASARDAEPSAWESLSYLGHRSGRSTPRIDTLMSSTPRGVVSWQEINPHHRLTIAFEPFPAGWDDTETASPKERMLATYLPPTPPRMMPVDEIFFIMHTTGMKMSSPLPDWAHEWVRNAILFGRLLSNNQLRTRDIYGLPDQESVFENTQFVIHIPMELNPHLAEDVNVTQNLFRLGYSQLPNKKQITRIPIQWAPEPENNTEGSAKGPEA